MKDEKSWREVIKVHPAADLFPLMSETELLDLGEDIKRIGQISPIVFYDDAELGRCLITGRCRLDGMQLAGLPVLAPDKQKLADHILTTETSADPYDFVCSSNIHHRHLTQEQRRELIVGFIKAQPGKSNRQIAAMLGVSHTTVGVFRSKLEATGQIGQLKATVGKDGRARPLCRSSTRRPRDASNHNAAKDLAAIVRIFGKDHDLGGKPTPVRKIAMKLGGLNESYVESLLDKLAIEPVDGYRAEWIEGSGDEAVWRVLPVAKVVAQHDLSDLPSNTVPISIESGPIVSATDHLDDVPPAHWPNLTRARRDYVAIHFQSACRCVLRFVNDADQMHAELGFASAADMLREAYQLDPETIRLVKELLAGMPDSDDIDLWPTRPTARRLDSAAMGDA